MQTPPDQTEAGSSVDDVTNEECKLIEERAARRDLASDDEVKELFDKYRGA